MRHDNFIPTPRLVRIRTRGRLPHWEVDNAIYSVTFRLNDSLPPEVVRQLIHERQQIARELSAVERARLDVLFALRFDAELDRAHGSCLLREHAEIVAGALKYYDRRRYELHAWCVMPNHVHVMLHMEHGRELKTVVQAWKSYTAHAIGRGAIWQPEYFDRGGAGAEGLPEHADVHSTESGEGRVGGVAVGRVSGGEDAAGASGRGRPRSGIPL